MAYIYNSDLTKELTEGGKIQVSRDIVPNQLAEKVVPTMEVNPKLFRKINVVKSTVTALTGAITVYTTPTDKDFFLCGLYLTTIKDAASDGTDAYISVTFIDGSSGTVMAIPGIASTAQIGSLSYTFERPIQLKRGTTVSVVGNTTAGVFRKSAGIIGYTTDIPNA